jgi:PAS domain S-box-containing protein
MGTTNPRLPFYSKGGSFYMNATTRFLATVSEEEKGKTRNVCNKEGYESVALVPFRSSGRILGLIHVADHRENMVPLKMVEQLENAAMQLGTAFQRASAEDALRKSEARYRHLFDNMLEGYAYCKMLYIEEKPQDFVYIHVNMAFESLTGLKNVIGKKVSEVIPGIQESNPELLRFYSRVALTGKQERLETYVEPLGIWFSIAAYSPEKEYFIAVFDNITERKLSEESLKASEHQYRQLVDNALVGVYKSTPDGKFLYVNDALARIFECENAAEMLLLPVGIRYKRPEDRETFLNILKEQGKVPYHELDVPTKTGKMKTIVISAVLEDNAITGMVIDITERRHLEAQLRHAQKMEAIGALAGGIAHDFNNILNVIIGYGSMVLDKLEADSPSKDQMSEVLAAAERAAVLTKRLLAFSRKQLAEVKLIDVNETVIGIQKMLVRTIGEDIDFQLDLADRSLVVMADAGQIEQVLMNLVSNARDAMPEGGRLMIGTGLQEIDDEYIAINGYGRPGMYAIITVADTGSGMDAETQTKIFEPFFTTKGIGEGTGLGLAISYAIIKQHNGYLKVYSEPGQGTEFKIYLPLIEEPALLDKKSEVPVSVKGGNETILVAEDDAYLRTLSRIVLESFGYTVITAEDGEDAITKFMENRERIGLVVLDMIMPKKHGKEVSEVLRKASPGVKILFVSGYTMDIIKKGLTESDFDFIHKPVRPQELLRKVREVLDK